MFKASYLVALLLCLASQLDFSERVIACRVKSEKLRLYTRTSIERFLNVESLESVYWPEEPLSAGVISKATGLNITLAETRYNLANQEGQNAVEAKNEIIRPKLVSDIFVTCSADRDRSYTLTINLELLNPFTVIDLRYQQSNKALQRPQQQGNASNNQEIGSFRILLPQSSFLVQLKQRISYDECLEVNYVQLAPNVAYEVECVNCVQEEQDYLDRIFSKKMSQLDAELDAILSEKLLLGLQILLNQQRLDLDLYMN